MKRLELHPRRTNSFASQSRSSGWLGGSPSRPKSLGVPASPRPKWYCQIRLTITRVESGLSLPLIQRASASLRPVDCGAAGSPRPRAGRFKHRRESRFDRFPASFTRNRVGGEMGPTSVTVSTVAAGPAVRRRMT